MTNLLKMQEISLGRRHRRALPAVIGTAMLLAACGSRTMTTSNGGARVGSPRSGRLSVSPAAVTPSSRVTFTFMPPQSAGRHGSSVLSYSLLVAGPAHRGCVASHGAAPATAVRGQRSTVALGPAQLGGRWCVGTYTARAQEFQRAACTAGQACPMYIRVVGVVATATFRVGG